jgi:tripartite-type tricarboxylate transporter receptor subunit TctC
MCYAAALPQTYPARPIRMIVPYAPGGPTDIVGRLVGQKLSERVGVSVVVDNRPGGTGILGGDMVAKAAPDGYTLLLCSTSTVVTSPILLGKAAYDGRRDFAAITLVVVIPYLLLVNPASGIGSVKELIALARSKPGALNYGSAGTGSTSHLAGALLSQLARVDIVHVPYKGSSLAATDLIGGRLEFMFEAVAAGMQYVKSGRLRPLGISTAKRISSLPDLPTIDAAGVPGYEISTWHGICAPRATPTALVERLNREIVAGINAPDVRERLTAIGAEVVGSSPSELAALINTEFPRWEKLLRELGVKGS